MENEWAGKSLTVWGVVIAVLTAALPIISLVSPELATVLTPDWISNLNLGVKEIVTSGAVLIGMIMVVVDRLSGNTAKTLVLRKSDV
jgi:hypothetical protein